MSKRADKNLIVGLDIGTSKVVAIVGEVNDEGNIEVVGIGSHPSRGLKKGVVVNIESTVHSIQRAVEEAELMAGCDIHSVYTGIAGSHVRSLNSHGIVAIRDSEVSPGDVDRVMGLHGGGRRGPHDLPVRSVELPGHRVEGRAEADVLVPTAMLALAAGLFAAAPYSPLEWATLIAHREYGL